jgi:hypothetical protein
METDRLQSSAGPEEIGQEKRARRRQPKDSLLAEKPPWIPGAGVLLIAAFLGLAAMAARSIEYQETVRISLVLRADETRGPAYGEGWLPQLQASKVKLDQLTLIELQLPTRADKISVEGQVSQISMACQESLYQVRVKLPASFSSDLEKAQRSRQELRGEGRIITWRGKLFSRMFRRFSHL